MSVQVAHEMFVLCSRDRVSGCHEIFKEGWDLQRMNTTELYQEPSVRGQGFPIWLVAKQALTLGKNLASGLACPP